MKKVEEILSIINDPVIGDDAWSDVFLDKAIEIARGIFDEGYDQKLFEKMGSASGLVKLRLLEVLLSFERKENYDKYISLIPESDFETAQLIIDRLRFWNLDGIEKQKLITASLPLKGKSKLLDLVIDSIK